MEYISLKENNIKKVSSHITDFLTPNFIYVPITNIKDLRLKSGDYIYKEQKILNEYSPVSGHFVGINYNSSIDSDKFLTLVIQNDGKELYKHPKKSNDLNKFNKENLLATLELDHKLFSKLKDIKSNDLVIINAIEDEINSASKIMLLDKKADIILKTIDTLRTIFKLENIYLAIKNNDYNSVKKIIAHLGTYPNINLKLVPNYYGLEDNLNLKNYLFKNNQNVKIIDLFLIMEIYNLLKLDKITTKKYLTITGDNVKTPKVINVKVGSLLKDIITTCINLKENKDYVVIANGLMNGKIINPNTFIITSEINNIFIMKNKKEEKVKECLNCGLCYKFCPREINPKYLNENKNVSLKYLSKCNGCNLCSYLCPSHIDLNPLKKEGLK